MKTLDPVEEGDWADGGVTSQVSVRIFNPGLKTCSCHFKICRNAARGRK